MTTVSVTKPSALTWVRRNLFRTPLDAILTILFGSLAVYVGIRGLLFVFVNGRWEIISVNLKLLMVGRWPADDLNAIAVAMVVLGLWAGLIAGIIAGRISKEE